MRADHADATRRRVQFPKMSQHKMLWELQRPLRRHPRNRRNPRNCLSGSAGCVPRWFEAFDVAVTYGGYCRSDTDCAAGASAAGRCQRWYQFIISGCVRMKFEGLEPVPWYSPCKRPSAAGTPRFPEGLLEAVRREEGHVRPAEEAEPVGDGAADRRRREAVGVADHPARKHAAPERPPTYILRSPMKPRRTTVSTAAIRSS